MIIDFYNFARQLIEAENRRQEAEERRASALASVEELRAEIARAEQNHEQDMQAAEKLCAAYQSTVEKLREESTMRQAQNVAITTREHVQSDASNPFAFVDKVGLAGIFADTPGEPNVEIEAELPSTLQKAVSKKVADPFRVSVGDPFAHIGQRGEGGKSMFDDLDLDLPKISSTPPPPVPEDARQG